MWSGGDGGSGGGCGMDETGYVMWICGECVGGGCRGG